MINYPLNGMSMVKQEKSQKNKDLKNDLRLKVTASVSQILNSENPKAAGKIEKRIKKNVNELVKQFMKEVASLAKKEEKKRKKEMKMQEKVKSAAPKTPLKSLRQKKKPLPAKP